MNRQIKFRAWDKSISRIREVTSINWFDEYLWVDETPSGDGSRLLIETTPLMQFTGLTDKNGKEIYEGDILLDDTEGEEYDFVEWSEYYAGWTTGQWFGSEELAREAENLEVIGNIYSNPELIK